MRARCLILSLLMSAPAAAAAQPALPPPTAPQATPLPAPPQQPSDETAAPQSTDRPASSGELAPPIPAPPAAGGDQSPARVFCDQNVAVRVDDPNSSPEPFRRYVGVWSDAAWDAHTCAALIVQHIAADGTASIVYVYGPLGSRSPVTGGVLRGTGIIKDGQLRFQNSDGSQYAFRPGIADMVGHWINPKGESFQATFKETP